MTTPPILLVTIDTEEDDWGDYSRREPEVTNVTRLPSFQELCDGYGVIPTYLCNWPVLHRDGSAAVLRDLARDARCGVGAHIHPWNTPPVEEETTARNSMLCNLPPALIAQKLGALRQLLIDRFESQPKVFRAGRWAFDGTVAGVLADQGYVVDTSVCPHLDWSPEFGPDYRTAPTQPYWFNPADPLRPARDGVLLEVPASVGFLGGHAEVRKRLRAFADRPIPRRLRMVGILDRMGISRRRWLSPELATGQEMIQLARSLTTAGARVLNFTFHSPTLAPGLTPFTRTEEQVERFLNRIETFFAFARDSGYQFATVAALATSTIPDPDDGPTPSPAGRRSS